MAWKFYSALGQEKTSLVIPRGWSIEGLSGALTGSTFTAISGGTEMWDSHGDGDTTTYTVPAAGIYRVDGWLIHNSGIANSIAILRLVVNTVAADTIVRLGTVATNAFPAGSGYNIETYSAGDLITAQVYQGDATPRTVNWKLTVMRLDG